MTREEWADLSAVWEDAAPADERRGLDALARRTPRLARATLWGELAAVILLAGTIVLAMVWKLGTATLLLGSLILLMLGWSAWKRHHLGAIAMLVEEGDRLSFTARLALAKQAELNRSAIGLVLILPGMLLTMSLGFVIRGEAQEAAGGAAGGDLLGFVTAILATPRGRVVLGFLSCAILMLTLAHLRLAGELRRLRALERDYAAEAARDGGPL